MLNKRNKAFICPIIIGVILIIIGLCIRVPGGALTTYSSLNGKTADDDFYFFDNKYSSIDEYVGGDAYNYIIGASLVAGKMAGAMASRSMFFVGGAMCMCVGLTMLLLRKKDDAAISSASISTPQQIDSSTDVSSKQPTA